ncbi:LytR/AlgR family response regulator transcription factor [Limosilactobacillus reuteri]|uniref:LytR/AlgR family response regulator transcription factor n=1 Tax=Limosilactobacillus reuteri TaxID=1598 RepID=UPI001E65380F|nr:LytTR family transcriptional regulator DNA-binding domain-containing protein [Limosilactobacillus reuteri]UFK69173.1 Accessory gene regulator protein A [Limosilactobacillus reuteri]
MTLEILLLEDNLLQLQKYKKIIQNRIMINPSNKSYDLELALYSSTSDEIHQYLHNNSKKDIFAFLDIEIGSTYSGIDIAKEIKNTESQNFREVCFISTYDNLLINIINDHVSPFDFILKNNGINYVTKKIQENIDWAYLKYKDLITKSNQELFTYESFPGYIHRIPRDNILFISTTSLQHRLRITCKDNEILFQGELKNIDSKNNAFFRVDRQILVNLNNIDYVDFHKRKIFFKNSKNKNCKISLRKIPLLRRLLQETSSPVTHKKQ